MGVITDYFSAPSDEAAARALDGGPLRPADRAAPFDTFESKNLDSYIVMAQLESALTGNDYEAIVADPLFDHLVAGGVADEPVVTRVSGGLQAALAERAEPVTCRA